MTHKLICWITLSTLVTLFGCKQTSSPEPAFEPEPAAAAAKEEPAKPEAAPAPAAAKPTVPVPEDVAEPPADAERTESGIASKVLSAGEGEKHPTAEDRVRVHYSGWTTDGKMFDSSVTRGDPTVFPLKAVIPGWTEGVQLMVEGEKRRFWIPGKLAYEGNPHAPQGTLVFDVELLEIL